MAPHKILHSLLMNRIRRSHPNNIAARLHQCVRKHPLLCYRMIISPHVDRHKRAEEIYQNHGANGILYFMLAIRGYADEAVGLASRITNFLKHRTIYPEAGGDAPLPIALHTGDFQLVTDHGYLLAWDMQNRHFQGVRPFWPDNGLLPVIARRHGHGLGIYVRIGGKLEPLVLRNGVVMLGAVAPDGELFYGRSFWQQGRSRRNMVLPGSVGDHLVQSWSSDYYAAA